MNYTLPTILMIITQRGENKYGRISHWGTGITDGPPR